MTAAASATDAAACDAYDRDADAAAVADATTPGIRSPEVAGNPRISAVLCYIRGGPIGHGGG